MMLRSHITKSKKHLRSIYYIKSNISNKTDSVLNWKKLLKRTPYCNLAFKQTEYYKSYFNKFIYKISAFCIISPMIETEKTACFNLYKQYAPI
jgi:hypothetical protein